MEGLSVRQSPSGFCVVELDFTADPDKRDPSWIARIRATSGMTEADIQREYFRNWKIPAGDEQPYYPEFKGRGGRRFYVHRLKKLIATHEVAGRPMSVVYRGWDFGRTPACVWAQAKDNRLWFVRELMPHARGDRPTLNTYQHADLVLYLSGQLDYEKLTTQSPDAAWWVEWIRENPDLPDPPWFDYDSGNILFIDFAGHEANKEFQTIHHETKEKTDAMVLESKGVALEVHYVGHRAAETIMRGLLNRRPDGWPGAIFDPSCHDLISGMEGGIRYPKPTKSKPYPGKDPFPDGYFEHLHDAAKYVAVNTIGAAEPKKVEPRIHYEGRRRVIELTGDGDEQADVYEMRRGNTWRGLR
jgi:hypothetical protein